MAAAPSFKNVFGMAKSQIQEGIYNLAGAGAPYSGGALGSGYGVAGHGSTYQDTVTGVLYVNEGDENDLYWSPVNIFNEYMIAWGTRFQDGVGEALADTDAMFTIPGSGIRIFGQGLTETDSGVTVAIAEDGPIATMTTTDEAEHLVALGVGLTTSVPYQPNNHGPINIEALVAMSSAITLRSMFIGFIGTAADALDPPVTGSGTTITLVQDDLAGMIFDAGLTDADGMFAPSNKSDAAANQTTASCACNVDFPAAGTYTRLRVTIHADGEMQCFKDGVLVFTKAAALDVDEEIAPVLLIRSTSAAVKSMLVKYINVWGNRLNS
jgi:hypothetical protein